MVFDKLTLVRPLEISRLTETLFLQSNEYFIIVNEEWRKLLNSMTEHLSIALFNTSNELPSTAISHIALGDVMT